MAQPSDKGTKARDEVRRMFREDVEAAFRSTFGRGSVNRDNMPDLYPASGSYGLDHATPGETFVESDAYKQWLSEFPEGAPSGGLTTRSGVVVTRSGLRTALQPRSVHARALVSGADASAGDLIVANNQGLIERGGVRPLTLRDLVRVIPTDVDLIEYMREVSRTHAAAPIAEAVTAAAIGSGDPATTAVQAGLKPEGGITFEKEEERAKVFAVHVPVTNRIIRNAPQMKNVIDDYLRDDLGLALEDDMIAGDGTGEHFTGILEVTGTIPVGPPRAGESLIYPIRSGKTQVRIQGRTIANAVVLNPVDSEKVDLLEVNNETNHFVGNGPFSAGPGTLWGMARVESEAVPEGTAVVGD